jgi:hypothetical protein
VRLKGLQANLSITRANRRNSPREFTPYNAPIGPTDQLILGVCSREAKWRHGISYNHKPFPRKLAPQYLLIRAYREALLDPLIECIRGFFEYPRQMAANRRRGIGANRQPECYQQAKALTALQMVDSTIPTRAAGRQCRGLRIAVHPVRPWKEAYGQYPDVDSYDQPIVPVFPRVRVPHTVTQDSPIACALQEFHASAQHTFGTRPLPGAFDC